jgi:hypothetical protein
MSAVLSEAETKFFSSRGQDVDASLRPAAAPNEPAANGGDAPATAPPAQSTPAANGGEQSPAAQTTPETQSAQQHVPLAALHEERKARQRAEQERQQLAQQVQQFQQQLEELKKGPQAPPPDPNQNPFEWLMHQGKINQEQLTQINEWRAQQEQQAQHATARQQFHQAISSSEQTFAAKQPDYYQAANFAMQQYDRTLKTLIPDPAERRQRVVQEALNVAWTVMQQGKDPAQFFYQYAKDMGYTGTGAPQPAVSGGAPPPAPQTTVTEVQQTIERGLKQRANSGGGGAPASEPTPEMALKMSPDDFNKWWAKQFRR